MSGTRTENLGLFNTNMLTDGDDFFDFDRDLNQNNNILDAAIGKLSTLTTEEKTSLVAAINELVAGKSSIDLDNLSEIGQAIMDKKVEVEALLQQNGYAKFTWKENNQISNLILQWGFNYYSTQTITFPIAFSNDLYSIIVTNSDGNFGTVCAASTHTPTTTSVGVKTNYVQQGSPAYVVNNPLPYNWFTVGY